MPNSYVYKNILTNDEYLESTGIDLNAELTAYINSDVGDDPAPRFIHGIEEWLRQFIFDNYSTNQDAESRNIVDENYTFNTHQIKQLKRATIAQIQYYLQNGTISNDSGYNISTKQIVDFELLKKISLAPDAKTALRNAGLANYRRQ